MKVLWSPATDKWSRTAACRHCDSVLSLEITDLTPKAGEAGELAYFCGNCNHENTLDAGLVPGLLLREIRRKEPKT